MSRRTRLQPEDRRVLAEVLAEAAPDWPEAGEPPDQPAADGPPERADGRHARSERSRRAMVDALLALLDEGVTRPSSAQIAERAGVTQRTLFNQFGDMDSLVLAAAGRQARRFIDLQPSTGSGPTEVRVARYCDDLSRLLEEIMNVRWAVVTNPSAPDAGTRLIRAALLYTRRRLADAFAPELAALHETDRDEVLDALELETDPVVWRLRRHQQELTADEAREVVRRTMLAVLRDAGRTGDDHRSPAGDEVRPAPAVGLPAAAGTA